MRCCLLLIVFIVLRGEDDCVIERVKHLTTVYSSIFQRSNIRKPERSNIVLGSQGECPEL